MQLPLVKKQKPTNLNTPAPMTASATKDCSPNKPFESITGSERKQSTQEGLPRRKNYTTAIDMANRMISNDQSFASSIIDGSSSYSDNERGNDLDEFVTDYDGESITDYDGIDLDMEGQHNRRLKTIPPPPTGSSLGSTHQIEFDPVELGRQRSEDKLSRASLDDQSSSAKNSTLSFSDRAPEKSNKRLKKKKKKASNSRVKTIVRSETKKIRRWKLASMTIVVIVGLVFSVLLFIQVYQTNVIKYADSTPTLGEDPLFYKTVFQIEDSANEAFRKSVASLEMISRALTESANSNSTDQPSVQGFPFVTLPNFQGLAEEMFGEESGDRRFQRVFWAPSIDASKKDEWEEYSFDHQGWLMDESTREQYTGIPSNISLDPLNMPVNISPTIHSNLMYHDDPIEDDRVWTMETRFQYSSESGAEAIKSYLPAWQTLDFESPLDDSQHSGHNMFSDHDMNGHDMHHDHDAHFGHNMHSGHDMHSDHDMHSGNRQLGHKELGLVCDASFVNFDLNTWFTPAAAAFNDAGENKLDGTVHVWNDPPFDLIHSEHNHVVDGSNCHMSLFVRVPIYDTLEAENVMGFVFALLIEELGFFYEGALKAETENLPLRLVVKEERNGRSIPTRRRTYDIRGSQLDFIGEGDFHDARYDDKVYKFKLRTGNGESTSSTVYLLYPTEEFYKYAKELNQNYSMSSLSESYPAIEAVWTASLVASVFAVILILFVCYNNAVEDRQRKLLRQAERTDAIVGSMFPANIQGRLMMIDDDTIESSKRGLTKQIVDQKGSETKFPPILTGSSSSNPTEPVRRPRSDSNPFNTLSKTGRKNGHGNWNPFQSTTPQSSNDTKQFSSGVDDSILRFGNTKPMADFYPNTTILMCDIAGFTAWSSARAPADVFRLLETIYGAFDDIARAEKVFKVETVGDCYVACAGLPVKQPKHAVIMAKFARKALKRYETLIKKLETYLGPDTVDLGLRMGIHSGPVTAGVLRGDKTRFQLFGDTVNTASRMESTGRMNMIQVSPQTANLLKEEGLGKWVVPRENSVAVKGKGEMQTYWLIRSGSSTSSTLSQASSASPMGSPKTTKTNNSIWKANEGIQRRNSMGNSNASWETSSTGTQSSSGSISSHQQRRLSNTENSARNAKERRLIEWMVETFMTSLKKIAKHRAKNSGMDENEDYLDGKELSLPMLDPEAQIIDEIKEVIPIQEKETLSSNTSFIGAGSQNNQVAIPRVVERQLRDYITVVSLLYHDHAFHNFEHCAHVLMSVLKLISRILESKRNTSDGGESDDDHAYGITSDPLLEFSCLFSALIHDVDHTGVPNSQLVKETTTTALRYHNRSVAEQHSIAVAWSLLMQPCYRELRECIYRTEAEFNRFRQLVVNSVMATDIMDRDLKKFRDNRWEKAFDLKKNDFDSMVPCAENSNRMATVVIEHMIQASDVAHTMQHWHIYLKFNERLFKEMYQAYKDGRAEKDPSEYWYEGELNFFKFYIIPLALKLKECGVFGVSGDEYFFHAESNRSEWALKGKEIVAEYMLRVESTDNSMSNYKEDSPSLMRKKQLLKLPEEKSSSFRSTDSLNSLV